MNITGTLPSDKMPIFFLKVKGVRTRVFMPRDSLVQGTSMPQLLEKIRKKAESEVY
jgi:hypothetical protein